MSEVPYEFTTDWFSHVEPVWRAVFQQLVPGARKILEIGCYEGRSAIWLMHNGFLPEATGDLYCIDSWEGGIEHNRADMARALARFDRNMGKARKNMPGITVHKRQSLSKYALASLLVEGHAGSFDFVYIDASHQAADVMSDLVLAFELCRVGGILACDDYLWNFGQNLLMTPKIAIDCFVNCFATKITPVTGIPLYQIFLKKIAA